MNLWTDFLREELNVIIIIIKIHKLTKNKLIQLCTDQIIKKVFLIKKRKKNVKKILHEKYKNKLLEAIYNL